MEVKVLREAGYEEALLGLSLSFYDHKDEAFRTCKELKHTLPTSRLLTRTKEASSVFWTDAKLVKAEHRVKSLAFKGGGHNKFLESIQVWVYIKAARCFWSEFDTYRVGITKNSSSTMHTLDKREVVCSDFEEGTDPALIYLFNFCLSQYKDPLSEYYKDITRLKLNLPEGWLQERQVSVNYMTLQNILRQRDGHRLHYWNSFKEAILAQVEHPELLTQRKLTW